MADNETEANENKKTAGSVWKSISEVADKVIESSKKGLKSAGSAINEFGDKSVLRIELSQLKSKLSKIYGEFGEWTVAALEDGDSASIGKDDPKVAEYLAQIKSIRENIEKHEADIAAKKEAASDAE